MQDHLRFAALVVLLIQVDLVGVIVLYLDLLDDSEVVGIVLKYGR